MGRTDRAGRLAEARRLSRMLVTLAERSRFDFVEAIESLGLPLHLARALLRLETPAAMSDLADRLDCNRSNVTAIADQLEQRGLVMRVPGADRRVRLLALTPDGKAERDRVETAVAEQSLVLRRLNDRERAVLAPMLERLLEPEERID
ncbi:MarR family transcriptional regulator [Actinoplanes sp. NPDC051470]|uniref:MarR family winged helix-turn-helix transcriptional regulator n=1 Tax=Actinoplanes sp. NPDC051470 TaxID=3157224 RepID=UPI00342AF1A1